MCGAIVSISHSARAGAVPLNLARCMTQGQGESGDRSKGLDLLFSADYADYADYCMRLAWATRTTAGMQEVEKRRSSCRGAVMFRMNGYVQDERYTAGAGMRRSGASQFRTAFDAGMRRSGAFQFRTAFDAGMRPTMTYVI